MFEGQVIGKLIKGDTKKLAGKMVDKDCEVIDKIGNIIEQAEGWVEEDAPELKVVDMPELVGKRVSFKLQPNLDSSNVKISRLTNLAISSISMATYLDA